MTIIVGILCEDGVVIGADSSATFGDGARKHTVEQPTRKIDVINDRMVVACSGEGGLAQRFSDVCRKLLDERKLVDKSPIEIGQIISKAVIENFTATAAHIIGAQAPNHIGLGALVASAHQRLPYLIEFAVGSMQPELKNERLWYVSMGSGQQIADPFLALLRRSLFPSAPPNIATGKLSVAWALEHVCDTNPGGVKEPFHLAVVDPAAQNPARELEENELEEHRGFIAAAYEHLAALPLTISGEGRDAPEVPEIPG